MSRQNTAYRLTSITGPSGLTAQSTPLPTPKAHEVLVLIHAVSLNWRDYGVAYGKYPLPTKKEPILCSDMAGEVVSVGEEVGEWSVGDRVTANFDQGHFYGPQMNWMG